MPFAVPGPAISDPEAIRLRLLQRVAADGRAHAEIARGAGMSRAQFGQILSGGRVAPSVATVGRILAALGLPWSSLD